MLYIIYNLYIFIYCIILHTIYYVLYYILCAIYYIIFKSEILDTFSNIKKVFKD